jgi:hypothetical protein
VWVVTPVASLEVDFWDVGVGVDAQGVFESFLVNVVECFSLIRVE